MRIFINIRAAAHYAELPSSVSLVSLTSAGMGKVVGSQIKISLANYFTRFSTVRWNSCQFSMRYVSNFGTRNVPIAKRPRTQKQSRS